MSRTLGDFQDSRVDRKGLFDQLKDEKVTGYSNLACFGTGQKKDQQHTRGYHEQLQPGGQELTDATSRPRKAKELQAERGR